MQISRRNALLGASAAVAVAGVPTAVAARAALAGDPVIGLNDSALLALEREWLAFREYIHRYPDDSDEARDPLYEHLTEIEEQIYATPAQTPQGVAIKLRRWQYFYAPWNHPWTPWWDGDVEQMALDEKGFALVMRDLERLAGSVPS